MPDSAALTQRQFLMWLAHDAAPEFPSHNMLMSFSIRAEIDPDRFARAFQHLVAGCDALRTVVESEGGRPRQRVLPRLEVPVDHIDLSEQPDPEAAYQCLREERSTRAFDIAQRCIDTALVRLGPEHHVWYLCQHHLITDGSSNALIFQRMSELYTAMADGEPASEPGWPQFAAARRSIDRYLQSGAAAKDEAYWRPKLQYATPPLRFYGEPTGDDARSTRVLERVSVELGPERSARLRELGASDALPGMSPEVRMWVLLQTALLAYLYRIGGERELAIGCPMRNRSSRTQREIVGPMIEICPIQVEAEDGETFRSLLDKAFEETFAALRHGRHCTSNPAHCRVFEATLNFHLMSFGDFAGAPTVSEFHTGLHATALPPEAPKHPVDALSLQLRDFEGAGNYTLDFDWNGQLVDAEQRERGAAHFVRLLDAMLADLDQPLDAPDILTDEERTHLLVDRNASFDARPVSDCLFQRFEQHAAETPDAVAVVYEDQRLSYRELNRRANQLARRLIDREVGPDTLVGLFVERSLETVVGILGIVKAGAGYLPLDPQMPGDRLAFILEDAESPVVVTQQSLADDLPQSAAEVVVIDGRGLRDAAQQAQWDKNPNVTVSPDNLIYVIYTSGSTGKPKGVQLTHRNVVRLFDRTQHWFGFDASDVWTLFHSYAFDFSVWELWGALAYGGKLVVVPYRISRSPRDFHGLLVEEGVTVLNQTPSAFGQLIRADEGTPGSSALKLRYVIFGGEALELRMLQPWVERHGVDAPQLVNMYGITETTVHVTYRVLTRGDIAEDRGSFIGVPIPDLKIYALNPAFQPVPVGCPGELYVAGEGLARGYLRRPELTAERFIDEPADSVADAGRLYRTGDVARLLWNGDIDYLGRADQQVKIRGFRLELGEVESVLTALPGVHRGVVIVREDTPGDKRLAAYVVGKGADKPNADALRQAMRDKLPQYMVPSAIMALDALPLTVNGKVDRRALPMPAVERKGGEGEAPEGELETQLAGLFAEVLRLPTVGRNDNFFDLGGHSLLAAALVGKIEESLGSQLPMGAIFDTPTVAALAEALSDGGEVKTRALMCLKSSGSGQPLFYVGSALQGRWLAEQLAEDSQPVYALNFFGLDLQEHEIEVPTIARLFLEEVRTVQPHGPYRLCAYCADTKLAYEMAAQLKQLGEDVDRMIFIDTRWGERPGRPSLQSVVESTMRLGPGYLAHRLWRRVRRIGDEVGKVQLKLRDTFALKGSEKTSIAVNHDRLIHIFLEKLRIYPASPLDVRITLLQTLEAGELGPVKLRALARGGIEVERLSGYHGQIFEHPHIVRLAGAVQRCLDRPATAAVVAHTPGGGSNGARPSPPV
ncbi:MAG: amino acid adenylation domain-containing protein [Myxococcales bacterium]|nr:amino acid adenylation domain-containing protein [Myxococcales bacterium]